ncbi:hypothetical protein LIER_39500 [Lithospermum erythrorhizon]|uniref:DUF6821 domain-containing protein n=1 Tax=Lithospermum erythrorhizon TaxID=34254 RepID=A0AAV3QFU2_LITER
MDTDNVSEELDEWQLIPSQGSSSVNAQWTSQKETPIVKDDFFSEYAVFPPIYHEGLQMYTSQESQLQESSSEHTIYSRLNDDEDVDEDNNDDNGSKADEDDGVENEDGRKKGVFVEEWRCRVVQFGRTSKRAKWWLSGFAMTGIVSMVAVSLWWMKVGRRRKRMQMERVQQLMLLIREKDQKINQLLLQIAQMNETLSTRRSVPVIRVV